MPLTDKIRERIQHPDCLYAAFPEYGGTVLSPMNSMVYPRPGTAYVDVRDVDEGLISYSNCSVSNGMFYFPTPANKWAAQVRSKLDLRGQQPNHTAIMRFYIYYDLDADDSKNYNYYVGMGQSLSSRADNPMACYLIISRQFGKYSLGATVCCQSPTEYENNTAVGSSSNGGIEIRYTKAELVNRWITLACTWDQSTRQMKIYWDGNLVKTGTVSTWTASRNKFSRNNSSFTQFVFGTQMPGSVQTCYTRIAWAALFNTVMTQAEIKNLSEA